MCWSGAEITDGVQGMIVYLNGEFLDEAAARVPVTDRGFLFGDGIFETLRVAGGRLLLWSEHLIRFHRGAEALSIAPVPTDTQLQAAVQEVLRRNQLPDAVVRITLTRGSGPRGYSPRGAGNPTLVITAQPAPRPFSGNTAGWDVIISRHVLQNDPTLAAIKHANRLVNILARAEADAAGADEALLLDPAGHLAEASGANLAWFEGDTLVTPAVETGALPGVMLRWVIGEARRRGWNSRSTQVGPEALRNAAGVFLTNSVQTVVPIRSIHGRPLKTGNNVQELMDLVHRRLWEDTPANP